MTFPFDLVPLQLAVEHALTKWTGRDRALPRDRLFKLGRPSFLTAPPRAGEVFRRPHCFVAVESRPIDGYMQMTSRRRVTAEVSIWCWYYMHELHSAEFVRARERALSDMEKVAQALCYPGALHTAPDGRETGLDGYSLREDGDRHETTGPEPRTGSPRVLEVSHLFRAGVELTAAT